MVDRVIRLHGQIDVLMYISGVCKGAPFLASRDADYINVVLFVDGGQLA